MKPQLSLATERVRAHRNLSALLLGAAILLFGASAGLLRGEDQPAPIVVAMAQPLAPSRPAPCCETAVREQPPAPMGVDLRGISRIVDRASRASGVDGSLLHAMIMAESSYDAKAVSPAGASGLMQLMPETARKYGVRDVFDPEQNVHGGARYMKYLLEKFDGDMELALAAYNSGENAVIRAGNRVPPHPETVSFVPKVIDYYRRFQARQG